MNDFISLEQGHGIGKLANEKILDRVYQSIGFIEQLIIYYYRRLPLGAQFEPLKVCFNYFVLNKIYFRRNLTYFLLCKRTTYLWSIVTELDLL